MWSMCEARAAERHTAREEAGKSRAGRREGERVQGLEGELTNKHIYLPENVSDGQQT